MVGLILLQPMESGKRTDWGGCTSDFCADNRKSWVAGWIYQASFHFHGGVHRDREGRQGKLFRFLYHFVTFVSF